MWKMSDYKNLVLINEFSNTEGQYTKVNYSCRPAMNNTDLNFKTTIYNSAYTHTLPDK